MVDFWLPEGTDIRATEENVVAIQNSLAGDERVEFSHAVIGGGMPRFMLTYTPEAAYSSYAQLLFRIKDPEDVVPMMREVEQFLEENYPGINQVPPPRNRSFSTGQNRGEIYRA